MTDYSKSTIYKIACKDASIDDIYIGSTCNIVRRRCGHKTVCNNPNASGYNQYVYRFIRSHGGWQNWDIYIIEQFSCTTKIAKEQVERGYIEELKPTLNKNVPANYQNGDVWDKSEYKKQYYEHNRDHITEYKRQYQIHNTDKIKQANRKLYERDKYKILERSKTYSESHKVERQEYLQRTIHCPCCNHQINLANRARHNRTTIYITNSSESSEEEPDTIIVEMSKLRDDNEFKLQEIQNTLDEIDKLID